MPKDAAPANPYSRVKFEPLAASLQEALESTRSYLCRQTRSLVVDNTDELVRSITFDIVETYWGIITSGMPNAPYLRPAPHIPSITLLPEETQESVDRLAQLISLLPTIEATYHLGLTYTALLDAQKRNKNGLFYTPPVLAAHLVDRATEELVDWSTARVLEPACGGGVLLTAAAERIIEATWAETGDAAAVLQSISGRLIGYDLDPMGAWLAQVGVDQLLLPFTTETNSKPPALVYQSDMLSLHGSQDFDLVITNPPFRKITLTTDMRQRFARSVHGHANLYSLFFDQCLEFISETGTIVGLSPAGYLAGTYFKHLRETLRRQSHPRCIELISNRSGVFEGVTQELAVSVFRKPSSTTTTVRRLDLSSDGEISKTELGNHRLPSSLTAPWILPRTMKQRELLRTARRMRSTLTDWGYTVSTGPVIWNRHASKLRCEPSAHTRPLIWAEAINENGVFKWQATRKRNPKWICATELDGAFLQSEPVVLLKRTTSSDQARRLYACVLPDTFIAEHGPVLIENHVQVLKPAAAQPQVPLETVTAFLNSCVANELFRCVSGSANVSVEELLALPLPDPQDLNGITKMVSQAAGRSEIERACYQLYALPVETTHATAEQKD